MPRSKPRPLLKLWRSDVEMAKKDDDLQSTRQSKHLGLGAPWQAVRIPRRRWAVRLVAYAVVASIIVGLVFRALGSSRGPRVLEDADDIAHLRPLLGEEPPPGSGEDADGNPHSKADGRADGNTDQRRSYNGPVRFLALAESLQSIAATSPGSIKNRNVLFAAASLQSAATLLPMACQMAAHGSRVHFALMSRSDISLKALLQVNGIDKGCPLVLHDARPDQVAPSSEARMTLAVARALYHINMYMHPQAILVDSTIAEERYFLRGMREQVKKTQAALIELPEKPESRLPWITRLDAPALAAWNKVRFDILVHSPRTGSGNLKRLLRSIARADLGGHSVPHLTVELPPTVEGPLERFLAAYQWPPSTPGAKPMPHMVSLRRRIPRQWLTEEESSVRFLESFWPTDPSHSHVLVLSPHVEVSPQFFHYIKYALLLQRHSRMATEKGHHSSVMGMSLSVPSTLLDGTQPFTPPRLSRGHGKEPGPEETAFRWQAPTSDAVLFMGDRWVELHSYVSQVLEKQHVMSVPPALLAKKEVGKRHPAWMEYALQLSRLRGYVTLYPSQQTAGAIVGVHTDLLDEPEEYEERATSGARGQGPLVDDQASKIFDAGAHVGILETLPHEGGQQQQLADASPLLSWDGKDTSEASFATEATRYAAEFRRQVGQCAEEVAQRQSLADKYARDLFCSTGESKP